MLKIYIFLFIFFCSSLSAEIISRVEVNGNQRVSSETIKMFADVSLENDFDINDFNNTLKNLYDTNFFNLIELKIENSTLNIFFQTRISKIYILH